MIRSGLRRRILHPLRVGLFRLRHRSEPGYECPICAYRGPFAPVAVEQGLREHALCPDCGSGERHRLQFLVLQGLLARIDVSGWRVLHVAPEDSLRDFIRRHCGVYETADLVGARVDHRVDLQALPFADASYDLVYASHVLEHVPDDRRAIAEIRRILKPGGIAILPVPIVVAHTLEYPAPEPAESGHVRAPGPDYFERLRACFGRVEVHDSGEFPERHQLHLYEDRSRWPDASCPRRTPSPGRRHPDFVPVCFA